MLAQTLKTLRRRRRWFLTCVLLGAATGLRLGLRQPRLYEATARVILTGSENGRARVNTGPTVKVGRIPLTAEFIKMREDRILDQVIRDLDLLDDPAFAAERRRHPDAVALRRSLLGQLRGGLAITVEPGTNIVDISFAADDPSAAAAVVNALVRVFTQRLIEERVEHIARASEWPSSQLAVLRHEVEFTRAQMIAVQRRLGNTGFNTESYRAENTLTPLTQNVVRAGLARDAAEQQYQRFLALTPAAQESELEALPETNSRSLHAILTQLDLLRPTQAALATRLGPNNPQFRAGQAELETLEGQLAQARAGRLDTLHVRFLEAQDAQTDAENLLAEEISRVYALGPDTVQYRTLLRQFTLIRELYAGLYTRIRTANLQAGLSALNVEVLDPAIPPLAPITTPIWLFLLQYTTLGAVTGVILSLAIQNFRRGLANVQELEAITDLPALAALPRLPLGDADRLAPLSVAMQNLPVLEQPHSRFADAIGNLQLNLQLSGAGAEPQFLLFTSATPSEGKTTVASNYAVSLARTSGLPVLLIDADLHRPNLHHRFGLPGRFGLSSVLYGALSLDQALQRIPEVPSLDILAAGPVPLAPYELLSAPAFLTLLRSVAPRYACVVIDAPPVLATADSVLISRFVDAVVYVVRQGKVGKNVVRRGRDLLAAADAPLAGVVFNAHQPADDDVHPT